MREIPILFSGPMVRAIREGRKNMTRRVVKLPPCDFPYQYYGMLDGEHMFGERDYPDEGVFPVKCPYGRPGDRLWVRETWKTVMHSPGYDNGITESGGEDFCDGVATIQYQSDDAVKTFDFLEEPDDGQAARGLGKWRPSIFMPRWASRITLEITDVRVERLQEISNEDALSEGIIQAEDIRWTPRLGFYALWDSINAKKYPWSMNPWVWVISFKAI